MCSGTHNSEKCVFRNTCLKKVCVPEHMSQKVHVPEHSTIFWITTLRMFWQNWNNFVFALDTDLFGVKRNLGSGVGRCPLPLGTTVTGGSTPLHPGPAHRPPTPTLQACCGLIHAQY